MCQSGVRINDVCVSFPVAKWPRLTTPILCACVDTPTRESGQYKTLREAVPSSLSTAEEGIKDAPSMRVVCSSVHIVVYRTE